MEVLHYAKANNNTAIARKFDVSESCKRLWMKKEVKTEKSCIPRNGDSETW